MPAPPDAARPDAAPPRPSEARPDDEHLDAALDPAEQAEALLLTLMSRLLAPRGVAALDDGRGLRVVAAKGGMPVAVGDRLDAAPPEASALVLPLRHGGDALGFVALGGRLSGEPYAPAETGVARSLAGATAASVRAGRAAAALAEAVRRQEARAQELRTLFELSQAFGRALDREAILNRLGFALMGQLLVARFAVALCDSDREGDAALDVTFSRGAGGAALPVPCRLADLRAPRALDPSDPLWGAGWRWAVPLRAGDVSRGVVLLGPRAAGELDEGAADFAAALAALAVGALETADRLGERIERERIEAEVALARGVQVRLLPARLPSVPGLDVAARWRPSRDVSGDTYEVADLGDGRLLVAVADVVGKGIGASLLMATLQAGFRLLRPDLETPRPDLAAATARLDRLVAQSTEPHQFVTLAWGIVEAAPPGSGGAGRGGRFRYVVAGHPPPRLLRAGGAVEPLDVGGPLLGVLDGAQFVQGEVDLGLGDTVLLYTDGATEAEDGRGEELETVGLDRLLTGHAAADAAGLLDTVLRGVDAWAAGGAADNDDLTLVAVRMVG
ncbi:PP2C family protein-serine/threonine phosphatase [Rubrivirga sp. S365]|uniref:PP2C family protein-serine/threonine phosphatase n=1 Tax=Rubrivirga litoralis TaxID=3075598 RepID=A0ABU3BPD8_9BACT|nr:MULTISPECIES: PP2C family protein-serine/threonine phosphatase [unclassified Rubrivirga]MDT0631128.1 PP2C family protein-serine/threonine phosphatase [Rubrivirga sp. F394]MDT7855359.1 PP2C family protein-serine/threonine phosphatase [Rubrivirga sp. S365]